jgi:trehalose 2-sulfotransferase
LSRRVICDPCHRSGDRDSHAEERRWLCVRPKALLPDVRQCSLWVDTSMPGALRYRNSWSSRGILHDLAGTATRSEIPHQRYWEQSQLARSHGVTDREAYLTLVYRLGSTSNGVFGAKLMWNYVPHVVAKFQEMATSGNRNRVQTLAAAFPNLQVVHLVRRDRVRQAVSWLRAAGEGVWFVSEIEPARPRGEPRYDFDVIAGMMDLIAQSEQAWLELYDELHITPFEVVYEDVLAPEGYENAVRGILGHLGVSAPAAIPVPRTIPQSDDLNEEWVQRFLRDQKAR